MPLPDFELTKKHAYSADRKSSFFTKGLLRWRMVWVLVDTGN